MSRNSSSILTIKCDFPSCEKQQVNVQIGQVVSTDAEWGDVTINGERDLDLCPDHLQELEDFLYGPDDDHAENNADGIHPFEDEPVYDDRASD